MGMANEEEIKDPPQKNSSRKEILIFSLLSTLIIGSGLGFGVFYYFKHTDTSFFNKTNETSKTTSHIYNETFEDLNRPYNIDSFDFPTNTEETTTNLSGKEYKYIGNTKDGMPHGKGTAYYPNGNIRFEGYFIGGKPALEGKSYYENGNLRAEVSNGNGIHYYESGNIVFIGELNSNAVPHGDGKEFFDDGQTIKYEGQFKNGSFHGMGKGYDYTGSLIFEGQYQNGIPHGPGRSYDQSRGFKIEGIFQNGVLTDGFVKIYLEDQRLYEGEFQNGLPHGEGKGYLNGKLIFHGKFVNGTPSDDGLYFTDQEVEKRKLKSLLKEQTYTTGFSKE